MAAEDPDVFDSLFDTSSRMSRLDALIADAKGGCALGIGRTRKRTA